MASVRGLASYTGISCPKEKQFLLLDAEPHPLRAANYLKISNELHVSS